MHHQSSTMPRRRSLAERFWEKVDRSGGPDACWPWTGAKFASGYGAIGEGGRRGRTMAAHRVAWELAFGPIPPGMMVCHRCDNPPCCNAVRCFFLGDQATNMADAQRKGRIASGERQGHARLTAETVRAIRALYATGKHTQTAVARVYGVSRRTVGYIVHGESWASLD